MFKRKTNTNLKEKVLYFSVILFLVIYILSFTKSCTSKDKREIVKTALVNPKNAVLINSLVLSDKNNTLHLQKKENTWIVYENEEKISLPADNQKIENFIKDITTVRNMYKISDKISKNSSFGLTDSSAFSLTYYYSENNANDSQQFHGLIFGNQDFSLSNRYIMTDKSVTIYEIDSSLDKYLSTSLQSWSEPYLISQEVSGKITSDDIQSTKVTDEGTGKVSSISDTDKLLQLRHGGTAQSIPQTEADTSIRIELGNKNSILVQIFPTEKEAEYTVKTTYFNNSKTKSTTQDYYSKISQWTYNKIKEITL